MASEQWKLVDGYKNYEVSTFGHVRNIKTGKILTNTYVNGYYIVTLSKNCKVKRFYIHRLVAEAFIPNPENKSDVNHINEDKSNNNVDNLNWMTRAENCNYGTRNKRILEGNGAGKHVLVTFENGGQIIVNSIKEAAYQLGINYNYALKILHHKTDKFDMSIEQLMEAK